MKTPAIKYEPCPFCHGHGRRPGPGTGMVMRREREARGVTREAVLEFFYKPDGDTYSSFYIVDLERDSRAWSQPMIESYRNAIELAVKARLEKAEVAT